jgi:hypothetical protein
MDRVDSISDLPRMKIVDGHHTPAPFILTRVLTLDSYISAFEQGGMTVEKTVPLGAPSTWLFHLKVFK